MKPVYGLAGLGAVLGTHVFACCPIFQSPPHKWDHYWGAGDPMARVRQEGHLEQSLLMKFPSGEKGESVFSPGACAVSVIGLLRELHAQGHSGLLISADGGDAKHWVEES